MDLSVVDLVRGGYTTSFCFGNVCSFTWSTPLVSICGCICTGIFIFLLRPVLPSPNLGLLCTRGFGSVASFMGFKIHVSSFTIGSAPLSTPCTTSNFIPLV